MADEWIFIDGKACYDSTSEGFTLTQSDVMETGDLYSFVVRVTDQTQGKLLFPSLTGGFEITENGTFQFTGKALFDDLIILPASFGGGVFDGCLEIVEVLQIPY